MTNDAKILVVDDEEVMREFLLEVFSSHNPMCAENGEEALRLLKENAISVVITDLKMPRMDGLELLQRIKSFNPSIQVIVVTGYASLQTASDCIRAGAADFLKKPFSIAQIRNSVSKALEAA
jgi:DNA-binding NtrC family response regulator